MEFTVRGIRTCCHTRRESDIEVTIAVQRGRLGTYLEVTAGGIPGYRSAVYLSAYAMGTTWVACPGVARLYDRLIVPAASMEVVLAGFRQLVA